MLNKTELVAKYAEKRGTTKAQAERDLMPVIEYLGEVLESGEGFNFIGAFKAYIKDVPARTCRNPKDGSEVFVEAKKKVVMKAMKNWQDKVNK